MADYYETLGLKRGAADDEIKKSYRNLAKQYHPDRNPGDKGAEEKFKKISEAYAVLSDPEKRKQYDVVGDRQFHQNYSTEDIFRGTDFGSIFQEFDLGGGGGDFFSRIFGGGMGGFPGGGGRGMRPQKGQDIEFPLSIAFMEAYQGAEKEINFRLSDGSTRELKVRVPAGARDGGRLRVAGKGANSPMGGTPGDLFIVFHVASHPKFERHGDHIETKLGLKLTEALLGTSKEVETPEGRRKVKVPGGVKPGTKIRLKGLGFPRPGHKEARGDLFAIVEYQLPDHLSAGQKEAIGELARHGL